MTKSKADNLQMENSKIDRLQMGLQINDLNKSFNGVTLFKDFNLSLAESTITCILGPSGCGKSTLLNIIGKVIPPDSGSLVGFDGKIFSYIFQEPRLLPWKTVRGNIEFVLDSNLSPSSRRREADRLINNVQLDGFANYYPSQLSGGMRQRVSIARAFACHSDIILMDEPLNGLDFSLKQNMIKWFSQIWKEDRRTVIFVTHNVDEALLLGNEIVVLSEPPVSTLTRLTIQEPSGERSPEEPHLKELKQTLEKHLSLAKVPHITF
jgi:NitT/TauT family transport system ATP-binding protein